MQHLKFALGALVLLFALPSFAAPVIFLLDDHPDGSEYDGTTNPYGIRIDAESATFSVGTGLTGGTGGPVTLTFDPMDLGAGATIVGEVAINPGGPKWDVVYTLSGLTVAGSGGFIAASATGSLTEQGGPGFIAMAGESNGTGVFIFDNDGHRLPGNPGVGWVGRGWLLPQGSVDDWLVTGTIIPLPASVWLFGASLLSLLGLRRKLSK